MATPIYEKPNFALGVWASAGDIQVPSAEKIATGHVVERPPYEISNYLENRQDRGLAYLFQQGISVWDENLTYPANALVKRAGVVYVARQQNTNADPTTNTSLWRVAFYDYSNGMSLEEALGNILNDEGFLTLYISKANPVATGKFKGTGFTADTGVPATGEEKIGYSFTDNTKDGFFHDGEAAVVYNDGQVVAKFKTPASLTEDSKNVVTMDILQQALKANQNYAVGDIYITTSSATPATRFGYGTWERFAQGRALVGFSENGSDPNWVRNAGTTFGDYGVILTADNAPAHSHFVATDQGGSSDINANNNVLTTAWRTQSDYNGYIFGGASNKVPNRGATSNPIGTSGSPITEATAHNNVQPSIVVYFWRRTA